MSERKSGFFLGFDCATKTFAFSLSYVDLTPKINKWATLNELLNRAKVAPPEEALKIIDGIAPSIEALDRQSKYIVLIDGETKDLFPGRADKTIKTVERIKAVCKYVNERIKPAIADMPNLKVIVEFQMGQNPDARTVASALITLFADYDVMLVGPSLKNKVSVSSEGAYSNFTSKYASNYSANKAHAKYNFMQIEKIFGTSIPETKPASLRGHIADSFMQVLGYLIYGSDEMQF